MNTVAELFNDVRQIFHHHQEITAWQKMYEPQVPKVGEPAADFTLVDTTGSNPITLSDFIGKKPVALVFGSYT